MRRNGEGTIVKTLIDNSLPHRLRRHHADRDVLRDPFKIPQVVTAAI
jgi:hypothetical protein